MAPIQEHLTARQAQFLDSLTDNHAWFLINPRVTHLQWNTASTPEQPAEISELAYIREQEAANQAVREVVSEWRGVYRSVAV